MIFPRRRFLGSSLLVFGSTLIDALATPLWKWKNPVVLEAAVQQPANSPVQFIDVAQQAGLTIPNVSLKPREAGWLSSTTTMTDGWISI
jgi:hypothetical protein